MDKVKENMDKVKDERKNNDKKITTGKEIKKNIKIENIVIVEKEKVNKDNEAEAKINKKRNNLNKYKKHKRTIINKTVKVQVLKIKKHLLNNKDKENSLSERLKPDY